MTYTLDELNRLARSDPRDFIGMSEEAYQERIETTVERLLREQKQKQIILVNGPSSSGKTTTAKRMREAFAVHGIHAEVISMDNYYRTRGTYEIPKDEDGVDDFESPECMDLPMLHDHLARLAAGEEIEVPRFDFARKSRTDETEAIRLDPDEVAVIEGIHSLNDVITGGLEERANGVYLSVESEVAMSDEELLTPEMLRFMRRAVRDRNFRGTPVPATLLRWASVRRGEGLYIAPYKHHAAFSIDTYLPYESCILMNQLQGELAQSENEMRAAGLGPVFDAIGRFALLDFEHYMPETSILHEFIG